jgi:hypothetical protein
MQKDIMTLLYSLANLVYDQNVCWSNVSEKVKTILEQAMKAHKGSGSIALLIR